jgi:hypothetical protein
MKKILKTLALAAFIGFGANAQDSNTVDLKYGVDKQKTEESISLYLEPYKKKNYKDAYGHWSYIFHNAPKRTKNLYIHGPKMILDFIKKEPENAMNWKDSLVMVYDQYGKYYPKKKGQCEGNKGSKLYKIYKSQNDTLTNDQMKEVNGYLKNAYDIDGNNITSSVINYYFITTAKLAGKEIFSKSDLLDMYANLGTVIEAGKAKHSNTLFELEQKVAADSTYVFNKKEKRAKKFASSEMKKLNSVEKNMEKVVEKHASCDKLSEIYNKSFEENKEDIAWLQRAAKLMKKKGCTDSDAFFKVADALYKIEPTPNSAYYLAAISIKKNDYKTANKYLADAIDQETDNLKKADYLILKAQLQLKRGAYSGAASTARQAASLRRGWGEPYLVIGQAYGATSRKCGELQTEFKKRVGYIAALEKFSYAKSIDPAVTRKANNLIGRYSAHLPTVTMAFEEGYKKGQRYKISGCWINETVTIRTK